MPGIEDRNLRSEVFSFQTREIMVTPAFGDSSSAWRGFLGTASSQAWTPDPAEDGAQVSLLAAIVAEVRRMALIREEFTRDPDLPTDQSRLAEQKCQWPSRLLKAPNCHLAGPSTSTTAQVNTMLRPATT